MKPPFKEKRKLERRHLIYYLRVFDNKTNKLLGHLVDISTEGFMLISEEPIETNSTFQLRMNIPPEIPETQHINYIARSEWSRSDINPAFYNPGFQILRISMDAFKIIDRMIEEFRSVKGFFSPDKA